jgi:hypothetical protein
MHDYEAGICHHCGEYCRNLYWVEGAGYCPEHAPLRLLDPIDFEMIYQKAGVPGPKRGTGG